MDNDDPECNLVNGTRHDLSIVSFDKLLLFTFKYVTNKIFIYLT